MANRQLPPLLRALRMSQNRYLYGLERTPDDRLHWSPGGQANTPLQLAGRMAMYLEFLAHILQTRSRPERPEGVPPAPASRAEATAAVEAAFNRLHTAIAALDEEGLRQPVPTPWGEMIPAADMLWWITGVIGYGQGQLNYLQMAYGDTDPNMPPNWGRE